MIHQKVKEVRGLRRTRVILEKGVESLVILQDAMLTGLKVRLKLDQLEVPSQVVNATVVLDAPGIVVGGFFSTNTGILYRLPPNRMVSRSNDKFHNLPHRLYISEQASIASSTVDLTDSPFRTTRSRSAPSRQIIFHCTGWLHC